MVYRGRENIGDEDGGIRGKLLVVKIIASFPGGLGMRLQKIIEGLGTKDKRIQLGSRIYQVPY